MEKVLVLHDEAVQITMADGGDIPVCGFLGPSGTYTEQGALNLLKGQVRLLPLATTTRTIRALETRKTDLGFIPIENSTEGNVTEAIRGVIHSDLSDEGDLKILAEEVLPIRHILFGSSENSAVVHSHPQALAQCSQWINDNLPNATIVRENSTAEAVRIAVERGELAIGNRLAGEFYGANALNYDIMDLKSNHTRFWLLGRGVTQPSASDRTIMVFTIKNETGTLVKALSRFTDQGISINKVDTLPLGTLDEYYFMVAVDGHINNPALQRAICELRDRVWKVKVLGSFQKKQSEIIYDPEAKSNGWIDLSAL